MEINRPSWQIKKICPCCGQGQPIFIVCPNCNYLTLQCEETGNIFLNPKNLDAGFVDNCPNCKQTKTIDFILADTERILKEGFTKDDYE